MLRKRFWAVACATAMVASMTAGLSVNVFAEDVHRTRAAGMNEQLTKPLNTEKMLRTIARYRRC